MKSIIEERYLTANQLSLRMGVSQATLSYWRRNQKGPTWIKTDTNSYRYPVSGVDAWLSGLVKEPTYYKYKYGTCRKKKENADGKL